MIKQGGSTANKNNVLAHC